MMRLLLSILGVQAVGAGLVVAGFLARDVRNAVRLRRSRRRAARARLEARWELEHGLG